MRYPLNTAQINGGVTQYLSGTADIVVGATGYTQTQVALSVTAALIEMFAAGAMIKAEALSGTASIAMTGAGILMKGKSLGSQLAGIVLDAKHGIPDPMPIPSHFTKAMQVIEVDVQDNQIDLPSPDRTINVEPVDRIIMVEAEVE